MKVYTFLLASLLVLLSACGAPQSADSGFIPSPDRVPWNHSFRCTFDVSTGFPIEEGFVIRTSPTCEEVDGETVCTEPTLARPNYEIEAGFPLVCRNSMTTGLPYIGRVGWNSRAAIGVEARSGELYAEVKSCLSFATLDECLLDMTWEGNFRETDE